jgi:hypothetical protein
LGLHPILNNFNCKRRKKRWSGFFKRRRRRRKGKNGLAIVGEKVGLKNSFLIEL